MVKVVFRFCVGFWRFLIVVIGCLCWGVGLMLLVCWDVVLFWVVYVFVYGGLLVFGVVVFGLD